MYQIQITDLGGRPDWYDRKACLGISPNMFDAMPLAGESRAARDDRVAEAKVICGQCRVSGDCLEWGLMCDSIGDARMIYGGLTPQERQQLPGRRHAS